MKTTEINIRDPYILLHEEMYYLYGTRSRTCWEEADGFDCYRSSDLENWEGPFEIFHRPEGFFADRYYWAPECYCYENKFYLVTTLGCVGQKKGIYILTAEKPEGPFFVFTERITPRDWSCIDGTLYFEKGIPYLIFSHSFEDTPDGDMCMLELTKDLKRAASQPQILFSAAEARWAKPIPFAKEEFGLEGDVYFTDGPCVVQAKEGLYMTWSSWGNCGYAVGAARSESGGVKGPWIQQEHAVYPENGGHGMVFLNRQGKPQFTLHFPNDKYTEHPKFVDVIIENGQLKLEEICI